MQVPFFDGLHHVFVSFICQLCNFEPFVCPYPRYLVRDISNNFEAHHGQVIIRFSTITMLFYFGSKGVNDLLRGIEVGVA